MKATYDAAANALAIDFARASGRRTTKEVATGIYLDFDALNHLVGLEVLDARARFSAATLAKIASAADPMTLEQLEKEFGLTAETWKKQLQRERLAGRKVGTAWIVNRADAINYLESRSARGRQANKKKARRAKVSA